MAIHFVGQSINAKKAHNMAQSGAWVPLIRGIYVDNDQNLERTIAAHAVRIAHYLYPNAYLSSISAVHRGSKGDGRLFISGRRNHRTKIRGLEIVQNQAPPHPTMAITSIADDLGELSMNISAPPMVFLESFRMRSDHAGAITPDLRNQIGRRVIQEFGSPEAAADAIWALASENGWHREGESAARFLQGGHMRAHVPKKKKSGLELVVAWHKRPIGTLSQYGIEWRWVPKPSSGSTLVRDTVPGKLPAFIESLLPEGWLATILAEKDARDTLRNGRRYTSNISIVPAEAGLDATPGDVLEANLGNFTKEGWFTGRYDAPSLGITQSDLMANLARIVRQPETPRLSGVQIKLPMYLQASGDLVPAFGRPFTHILKPAGSGALDTLPIVEWICLQMAGIAGFDVPASAIIRMPGLMAPALLIERFDIGGPGDCRRLAVEDFCSVLEQPAAAKYDSKIESVAMGLRALSTAPEADLIILFRRALFAWLIGDGNMHLKNLALLKIAEPQARTFKSVRLAPVYGAATTWIFPGREHDRMSLMLNGKDSGLRHRDFMAFAQATGISEEAATEAMLNMSARLTDQSNWPRLFDRLSDLDLADALCQRIMATIHIRTALLKQD